MSFSDPAVTTRSHLAPRLRTRIFLQEPDSDSYDYRQPCLIINDLGSRVLYMGAFLDSFLQFEVRAATREDAETLSRQVWEALHDWISEDSTVVPQSINDFPQWNPEADRKIPAYTFSARFWLRPSTQESN